MRSAWEQFDDRTRVLVLVAECCHLNSGPTELDRNLETRAAG